VDATQGGKIGGIQGANISEPSIHTLGQINDDIHVRVILLHPFVREAKVGREMQPSFKPSIRSCTKLG
jgi:hypothetical protein